jgi:hypothetical protein
MPIHHTEYSSIYSKHIPSTVSLDQQVCYRFPFSDTHTFRFPSSISTFWMNFRFGCESPAHPALRVDILVRTTEGQEQGQEQEQEHILFTQYCHSRRWYSTYWPIPSFATSSSVGVYLRVHSVKPICLELQGFSGAYPPSPHYLLLDPHGSQHYLFCHEAYRNGSIHRIMDEVEVREEVQEEERREEERRGTLEQCRKAIAGVHLYPIGRRVFSR